MASIWAQRARNLPAQQNEATALETLLREDLEFENLIKTRRRALRGRIYQAESAAKAISQCINVTDIFRGVYGANTISTEGFEGRITKALEVHSSYPDILTAIPSTSELLATWSDILRLTDEVSASLERAKLQAEVHLHMCAVEQIAHESAAAAAKRSLLAIGGSLNGLKGSISQNRKHVYSIRCLPTELLQQIFNILIVEKQAFLNSQLNTFPSSPKSYSTDPAGMWKTINFVPIILSGTCKRWRDICESTPSLWRFLRIPTTLNPEFNPWVIGGLPFARAIANTNGQNLEITLYPSLKAETVTKYISAIPSEHSIARLNIIEGSIIPPKLSTALGVWFIGHPGGSEVKIVDLVPTRLQKAQYIFCNDRLPLIRNGPLLLRSLHITLSKACVFPGIGQLLTGLPVLQVLKLWFVVAVTYQESTAYTHHSLHTISISSCALPILQLSVRDGVSIPAFRHLQLLDVNKTFAYLGADNNAASFALITHLTIEAVSSPRGSVKIRAILDVMTALLTLRLEGTAVGPGLNALFLEPVMRIPDITLHDSDANCAPLREYFAKLAEESQGGPLQNPPQAVNEVRLVRVTWKNCPGFLRHYGAASGNISSVSTVSAA